MVAKSDSHNRGVHGSAMSPRISLCMIVRDNEAILGECLRSIRPWVDEMIVVDTGSRDATSRIAAEAGALVSESPWKDSFAEARNASIARATGDWIFWMDSDDVIDPQNGRRLRSLLEHERPLDLLGFVMQVHCPGAGGSASGDVTVVDHIKLFRNRADLRFEGRIHEQILPAIRRAGGEVAWTDVHVVHKHGSVTAAARAGKHARDLRLLELEYRDVGEHPFVLFNLGMTYCDMDRHQEATEYLERCLLASTANESHLSKAYSLLVACHLKLERFERAEAISREAVTRFPDDPETLFRHALCAHHAGRHRDSIACYRQILAATTETPERKRHTFSSGDAGIGGHKARHNLAAVLADVGRLAEAEAELRIALDEAPHFQAALAALGSLLIRQKKFVTARLQARHWLRQSATKPAGMVLAAEIAEAEGRSGEAIEMFESLRAEFPNSEQGLDELARLYFASERWNDAEIVLRELNRRRPVSAGLAHNLGAALLANGKISEATEWLQKSLELRPHFSPTRALWEQAVSQESHANS
jgi:tetratricopeptide (TPR) repeat protein